MDSGTNDKNLEPDAQSNISRRSTSARRSNTPSRIRPRKTPSNTSSAPSQTPSLSGDDNSLTSFPSLSPSLANSPEQLTGDAARSNPLLENGEATSSRVTPPSFQGLFSPAADGDKRSTLFFDGPQDVRDVPGTLHLQGDMHIRHLISRGGAIKLVKQLSSDLAQRDAHITMVQRKAEERERLLRKMLRECEVSNLDIENRLKELERSRTPSFQPGSQPVSGQSSTTDDLGMHSEASIDERMSEALSDDLEEGLGLDLQSRSAQESPFDTIRARQVSGESGQRQVSGTSRGWKGLFGGGAGTIRRATAPGTTTGESDASLAVKPQHNIPWNGANVDGRNRAPSSESRESTSSNSMATWALRMVSGNPQNARLKARVATANVSTDETGPMAKAAQPARSTSDSRSSAIERGRTNNLRSSMSSANRPLAPLRLIPPDQKRLSGVVPTHSPQSSIDGTNTNLGPVEMDTILPEDTRPPTLAQTASVGTGEYLTDNFGFIYDNRRRRKMREAASAMPRNKRGSHIESLQHHRISGNFADIEEDALSVTSGGSNSNSARPDTPMSAEGFPAVEPGKRWQDFLKLSNLRTELLSLTPSPTAITDVTTGEPDKAIKSLQTSIRLFNKGSMPAPGQTAEPSTTRAVSENAEISRTLSSYPSSPHETAETEIDPVKVLVDHLSEVHEAVQKEKTIKWNDFLRKVRADRRRDAVAKAESDARSRGSEMPETLLADGEMIGVAGLGVRGKVGRAKGNEFRSLVLAGVPTAFRSKIWAECSGALSLRVPGYYEDLTNSAFTDETIVQQIQMDIPRTLTDNIYFRHGAGVDKLKEVLLAYARRNPDIGYCQGMNLITANLLLIMPTAEDTFWVLTSMVEKILPSGYYSPSLITSRADQVVLRQYVTDVLPQLSRHLDDLGIELEALTFQWFLSVFTDCLSAEALFRVWDVVLCLSDATVFSQPQKNPQQTRDRSQDGPSGGSATFLFQVAVALLKLNEKSLLACESPAEVYRYINRGMTDHAISIDNLIGASEGLRKEVRSEEVVERRRQAVQNELEMMRRRDAIRKGKGRADSKDDTPAVLVTNGGEAGGTEEATPRAVRRGRLSREASRRDLDEEEEEAQLYGELEIRTPMPIDEEKFWRA